MGLFDGIKKELGGLAGGLAGSLLDTGSSLLGNAQQPSADAYYPQPAQAPAQAPVQPSAPQQDITAGMYSAKLEKLIDIALADGELTEKEKQILYKKAQEEGIDLDEFEMVLDAKLSTRPQQAGAPAPAQGSAPKSNKFGDIKKCPACGAMLQSYSTRCPDCGYEFRNIQANGGIQRLFEMLNEVESQSREDTTTIMGSFGRAYGDLFASSFGGTKDTRRKKAIIQNFPIPTTKEDILEFLALAVPLAKKPSMFDQDFSRREMYPIWRDKCEQIIMKAKFSMKDDPQTLAEILEYGKQIGIK